MISNEEIKQMVVAFSEVFATREEIVERFDAMHEQFSELQNSVDTYAKKADTYFQEMVMLGRKVDRLETWIQRIAQKIDFKLEY
ncbi:MAG: hypothetical protein HY437_01735 [Candidatus Magasanikbacteria bacterium]|nr:hypothetical protein [Candidatus Magasanikbacteria bacterium]